MFRCKWLLTALTAWCTITTTAIAASSSANSTYYNPVLAGWHSDPSCTTLNNTYFCVTSTFDTFPGLPLYASKNLLNWKLVSHAWNRESQLPPGTSQTTAAQQSGFFAATVRARQDTLYVVCVYLGTDVTDGILGTVFRTTDPFDEEAWSDPVLFNGTSIDPDLFWDDDGTLYVAQAGIVLQKLDLESGELSQPAVSIWNGTGGASPEGPHLYKKDGFYYLLIAEGGTELNHSITIARSTNIEGPYESYANNPILTNRGTDEYFQTVGHGDLFQDSDGHWWGLCLSTRSGPAWEVYPMGRETVLFPASWAEGEWPVLDPVRGNMTGWPLPSTSDEEVPGEGPFNAEPDVYDFEPGSKIPRNLIYFRVPRDGAITVPENGTAGLRIVPSRNNLTGIPFSTEFPELTGQQGIAFVGRRQTHTIFDFSVDLTFAPQEVGQEAGVTVFLDQVNHIDLGVLLLPSVDNSTTQLFFRLQAEAPFVDNPPVPPTNLPTPRLVEVPSNWTAGGPYRLQITTPNATHYSFAASLASDVGGEVSVKLGEVPAQLVSGGNGTFIGSLLGAYATCNGAGEGLDCPEGGDLVANRWRYTGLAQLIEEDVSVPEADVVVQPF